MQLYKNGTEAISKTKEKLYTFGRIVPSSNWQSIEIDQGMWELFNHSIKFKVPSTVSELKSDIRPNLPWADDHFNERVSGVPYNPPPSNEYWPFAQKNNKQFKKAKKFSHTYPERIWPPSKKGIRFRYGNLDNIVELFNKDKLTRQAFLPIWFPEDTGAVHGERVPCTLGYHFIIRDGYMHVNYYIRSCDYLRHFRDDIYLCCRKLLWIIRKTKQEVKPGFFTMYITSLHVFENEKNLLKLKNK